MAGSLPHELIVKIAEHLVEQVEPDEHLKFGRHHTDTTGSFVRRTMIPFYPKWFHDKFRVKRSDISPLALALFSPVLLDEYIKILLDTKVFYFYTSAYLYDFINAPGISEAAIQRRRGIRLLRFSKWGHCDCSNCCPWDWFPMATCSYGHGYDRSLGLAIRLMPRVTAVHIDRYVLMAAYKEPHEAEAHILTALQPVLMRSQDLSTVLFNGQTKFREMEPQPHDERNGWNDRATTLFTLSLFAWAKDGGLLDMVDLDDCWADARVYRNCAIGLFCPNPVSVLQLVWSENDNGRRREPPESLLRHWNKVWAEEVNRVVRTFV